MNLNTILDSILNTHKYTSAIITAAGSSRRMGMSTTKQTYEILGIPVAVHSILAFEKSNFINDVL